MAWRLLGACFPMVRLRRVLLVTILAPLLVPAPAGALEEGPALLRCQQRVERAAGRYARARHQALSRCFQKALRCPAVLDPARTAADDECLASVGARCNRLIGRSARTALAVERAGPACTLEGSQRKRISDLAFFDDEGLGFSLLAPLCPEVAVRESSAETGSTCQQRALTCSIDTAVARSFPRVAELLVRLGIPSGVGGRCLMASLCGNAILDGDEECDRGVANSDIEPDTCRTTCLEPWCGDGVVDEEDGEECDDGNARAGDGCDEDCFLEEDEGGYCGDGSLDPFDGEECDDGNLVPGDGCDEDCFLEEPDTGTCGDGIVDDDEDCDAGAGNSDVLPNTCRTDCTEPECGDGVVDPDWDETCEPPGTILCDDVCELRLPVLLRAEVPADPVAACQLALTTTGRRLFRQTRAGTAACVGRVARCILGFSEARDPDGDRADACVERADRRCLRIAEKLQALRDRLTASASAGCGQISLPALLNAATGLGFADVAATCEVPAGAAPSPDDLVRCALHDVRCGAEASIADAIPRAYELLGELFEVDGDEAFPCVRDPDDLEE